MSKFLLTILLFPSLVFGSIKIDTNRIFLLTNQLREEQQIAPLQRSKALDAVATEKLIDMRINHYFSHTSPTGLKYYHIMNNNGYTWSGAGENLAKGYNSADDTVIAWEKSPSHLKNLIEPRFNEIGIATDGYYTVQIFAKSK